MFRRSGVVLGGLAAVLILAASASTAPRVAQAGGLPYIVNSTSDVNVCNGSACTLRGAITLAGPNELIHFNIPATDPGCTDGICVIKPATIELPPINSTVTINGYTQPGASANTNGTDQGSNAAIKIRIDGSLIASTAKGLRSTASNVTIKGLSITNFSDDGMLLSGAGARIEGNFVGIAPNGTTAAGNGDTGVFVQSSATVGGTAPAARNVISGNDGTGVYLANSSNLVQNNIIGLAANGNVAVPNTENGVYVGVNENTVGGSNAARNIISGNGGHGVGVGQGTFTQGFSVAADNNVSHNYIGLNAAGSTGIANQGEGVAVGFALRTFIGPENVISGNNTNGVSVASTADQTEVSGNLIGTDATGTQAVLNQGVGVSVNGADTIVEGNLISGNLLEGISVGNAGNNASIVGNRIGVNLLGTGAVPNLHGIALYGGLNVTIGGQASEDSNVISGNTSNGVLLDDSGAGLSIIHNLIGTQINGTSPLPNVVGIRVVDASGASIGGDGMGEDNVIAFNQTSGITVTSPVGISIRRNSIHSNGNHGIDLGQDGVTANDPGDLDVGANNRQNKPVLDSAEPESSGVWVDYAADFQAGNYMIDFFSSDTCDSSGFGEGAVYRSFVMLGLPAPSMFQGGLLIQEEIQPGLAITALATKLETGDTSEFSNCVIVGGAATGTPTPTASATLSPTPTATPSATPTSTGTPTASASPTATGTPTNSGTSIPSATPTATPTPTPSPQASPSPTPSGGLALLWSDSDCDGEITSRDSQALLRRVLDQAPLSQDEPCPDLGETVTVGVDELKWGDWDCDGQVTTRDNQALLRRVLGQTALSQTEPCPDIGQIS